MSIFLYFGDNPCDIVRNSTTYNRFISTKVHLIETIEISFYVYTPANNNSEVDTFFTV